MSRQTRQKQTVDTKQNYLLLNSYVSEIKKYPILTQEEEKELSLRAQKGDIEARKKLISCNLRFVVMLARRYQNSKLPLMDIINEGNLGLAHAVDKFDPSKEVKFTSYAVWWIKWAILKAIYEQTSLLRIPLYKANEYIKIRKHVDKYEFSKEAIDAADSNISAKEYEKIKLIFRDYEYLDHSSDGNMRDALKIDNIVDIKDKSVEKQVCDSSLIGMLQEEIGKLSEIEQEVIIRRYGLFGQQKLTLEKLSERFDCTKERIRQIEKTVINRLRQPSINRKFKEHMYL